jgi:hypothetical protein
MTLIERRDGRLRARHDAFQRLDVPSSDRGYHGPDEGELLERAGFRSGEP